MVSGPTDALAIHVEADVASSGAERRWPVTASARDTARRMARICERVGVAEQRTLIGSDATIAALLDALAWARGALSSSGFLVLTFSGHTRRGDGPVTTARWCLFDGEMELSRVSTSLADRPDEVRLVVICDSCYAASIARTLAGPQGAVVLASCGEDQTMVERASSQFAVSLEELVGAAGAGPSLEELRIGLEHDTPDSERPTVWTNDPTWWSRPAIPL
jgi:hypothetical protein